MNFAPKTKVRPPEITCSTPVRVGAQGKKLPLTLLSCAVGLLLGLNSLAAVDENKTALVFVNTRVSDREKFDSLIAKEFPNSKVLYTSEDANVNDDVRDEVMHGVRQDGLKKYHSVVIIGDFKNASVPEAAVKSWMTDTFASAKKQQAPQLHLLSTSRKPPSTYLRWVEVSGGKYRQLKAAPNGSYE